MKKVKDKQLFDELDKWSMEPTSYSMNDFYALKGISLRELQEKAKYCKKFHLIIGQALSRLFDNADVAFRKKVITREELAGYLKERGFDDPEWIIQDFEWEMEEPSREALRKMMENYLKDPEGAQFAAEEILNKYW